MSFGNRFLDPNEYEGYIADVPLPKTMEQDFEKAGITRNLHAKAVALADTFIHVLDRYRMVSSSPMPNDNVQNDEERVRLIALTFGIVMDITTIRSDHHEEIYKIAEALAVRTRIRRKHYLDHKALADTIPQGRG